MEYKRAQPMIRTSVLISPELYQICKDLHIKFSEAMRVGISIILAERGIKDYDNKLNLYRKMNFFREELEKLNQKINENETDTGRKEDLGQIETNTE